MFKLDSLSPKTLAKRDTILIILSLFQAIPFTFLVTPLQILLLSHGASSHTIACSAIALAPYSLKFIWSPAIDKIIQHGYDYQRLMMIANSLIAALFVIMAQLIDHTHCVLVCCFIMAVASATNDEVMDAYSATAFTAELQPKVISMRVLGYRLGMLATMLVSWLAYNGSWSAVLTGLSLLILLISLPVIGALPTCRKRIHSTKLDWLAPLKNVQANAPRGLMTLLTSRIGELWIYAALTVYLIKYYHWSENQVVWSLQFFGVIASIIGTRLASKYINISKIYESMRLLSIAFFLCCLLLLTTLILHQDAWIFLVIMFYEVIFGMKAVNCQLLFYTCIDNTHPSYSCSLFNALSTSPRLLFPPFIAIILQSNNWVLFFQVGIFFSLLSYMMTLPATTKYLHLTKK